MRLVTTVILIASHVPVISTVLGMGSVKWVGDNVPASRTIWDRTATPVTSGFMDSPIVTVSRLIHALHAFTTLGWDGAARHCAVVYAKVSGRS